MEETTSYRKLNEQKKAAEKERKAKEAMEAAVMREFQEKQA